MKTELSYDNKNELDCFFNMNHRVSDIFHIKLELEEILEHSDNIELSEKLWDAIGGLDKTQASLQEIRKMIK